MAHHLTGITVERSRVEIRAPGSVSAPACRDDPDNCCGNRSVGAIACCAGDAELPAELGIVLSAPVGSGGATVTFEGDLGALPPAMWGTSDPIRVDTESGAGASLTAFLYCASDDNGWFLEGSITDVAGTTRAFRGELTADGSALFGEIALVGEDEGMHVVVEGPCPPGFLTECTEGGPCGCPQISGAYTVYDEGGTELGQVLRLDIEGVCRFQSTNGRWSLDRDTDAEVWRLTDHLEDRVWIFDGDTWDCCTDQVLVSEEDESYRTVSPIFDCCDGGSGGSGSEGTIATACCAELLPETLYAHLTSACGCFNYTREIVWQGSMWRSVNYTDSCSTDDTIVGMWCISGVWRFSKLTSASCPIDDTAAASVTCFPFSAVFNCTIFVSAPCGGCAAGTPVTVVVNTNP